MAMKKAGRDGAFPLCLAFNALINFHWTIPAWVLLALHFAIGLSIWWFVGALVAWLCAMLLATLFLMLVDRAPKDGGPSVKPDPDKRDEILAKSRAVGQREVRGSYEPPEGTR